MFKYVELCIELKKGRLAKDGLIQYRIVCQQVNVNSLEEVIKHFLKLATEKAESAQAAAASAVMLLGRSGISRLRTPREPHAEICLVESEKDRTIAKRTPWFKFLWELIVLSSKSSAIITSWRPVRHDGEPGLRVLR